MASAQKANAIEIELYSYHDFPPFVTGDGSGLTYDLANYLSQKSNQKYQFRVTIYPRKRLDNLLNTNSDLIVPWVSPAWFGKDADTKFKWSSALLSDGNAYVSPVSAPLDILDRSFLYGRTLGGVLGHRYVNIDEEVAKGNLSRMNTSSERTLMLMVANERVDVAVIADSAARYLSSELELQQKIHFSSTPHSVYLRRILISGHLPKLATYLDEVTEKMGIDPSWIAILEKYNLN